MKRTLLAAAGVAFIKLADAQTHVMANAVDLYRILPWKEAFAEGPFDLPNTATAGALDEDIGITTSVPAARAACPLGWRALLHLDDREAERAFRLAVTRDPACAFGYLGLALANEAWPGQAALSLLTALRAAVQNAPGPGKQALLVRAGKSGVAKTLLTGPLQNLAARADATLRYIQRLRPVTNALKLNPN